MSYIFFVLFIIVIVGLVFAFNKINEKDKPRVFKGKYPEGHFMSLGIAMGLPIGIPLGIAMDNIALGPGLGVALGVAIGSAMEAKAKKEGKIRPLTKEEEISKKWTVLALLLLVLLGLVLFGAVFWFGG